MGSNNCCSKIYYINVDQDDLLTGNLDSRRNKDYLDDEFDDNMYIKPNSSQQFFKQLAPVNPFKENTNSNIKGTATPFVLIFI